MALQDLTPQLRTRLSRVERAVGWFVFLAIALLVFGFVYYIYHEAESRGWFTPKFKYQTCLNNAAGLKVGQPVKLMGFTAGEITEIIPNEPDAWFGVTINFTVLKPHYGYIRDDSKVKVSSDLLGNRFLEITKGKPECVPTINEDTNKTPLAMLAWKAVEAAKSNILIQVRAKYPGLEHSDSGKFDWFVNTAIKDGIAADHAAFYTNLDQTYWIPPEETAALNERLEKVASQVEAALPNILNLTNKLAAVLDNATTLTSNLNTVANGVRPIVTNVDTNLPAILAEVTATLENLAGITSNLNAQVHANTNMLTTVTKSVADADDLVQGLKRHWLLRSAFKPAKTNAPAKTKP